MEKKPDLVAQDVLDHREIMNAPKDLDEHIAYFCSPKGPVYAKFRAPVTTNKAEISDLAKKAILSVHGYYAVMDWK